MYTLNMQELAGKLDLIPEQEIKNYGEGIHNQTCYRLRQEDNDFDVVIVFKNNLTEINITQHNPTYDWIVEDLKLNKYLTIEEIIRVINNEFKYYKENGHQRFGTAIPFDVEELCK